MSDRVKTFVDRLLAAMFDPVLPADHPACLSRLDVWDGKDN